MKLTISIAALALLGAASLGACGSDEASSDVIDLDDTTWTASAVEGHELAGSLDLAFADGRISVTGGCNTMNGSYSISDGHLTAGPLASTMMACPDPLMAQDAWFGGLLDAGVEVSIVGGDLLMGADDVTITFSPAG